MPTSSIILTIHQKAWLLPFLLDAIKENTDWTDTDIIFVVDGCFDDSELLVREWCFENKNIKSTVLTAPNVFEVAANNIGIRASNADYVIINQDDCIPKEKGWNKRILLPFTLWGDVFAVTGGCGHNWSYNPEQTNNTDGWSTLLNHHDHANKTNTDRNTFYIRDTVNRGPLAVCRKEMALLNNFDEEFYPLDSDEHDLMYRQKKMFGKKVGYVNILTESRPEWGGTRQKDGKTKDWVFAANRKNAALLYSRHKDIMHTHTIEERKL